MGRAPHLTHLAALGGKEPAAVLACIARRCGKADGRRRGHLSRTDARWVFTYPRWFRVWVEPVRAGAETRLTVQPGWLVDTLELTDGGEQRARFLVVKTRAATAARLARMATPAEGKERVA